MMMTGQNNSDIRVMHVVETLDVGGAETVVANLVNQVTPGFHADICCLQHAGPIANRISPNVNIVVLGKAMKGNDYLLPFRLARVLRAQGVHIVHSHDWGTLLETAVAAVMAGIVVIHMVHGPSIHYPNTDRWAPIKKYIRRLAERLVYRKVYRVIAVSEMVRRELIEDIGLPEDKIVLIRNGITIPAKHSNTAMTRASLGITPDEIVLIAVGRLAEIKNYRLLLDAYANARKSVPSLTLVLVGDGPERAVLEEKAQILGIKENVHFLGSRSDVGELLSASDIFALSSRYEGISLALLEAMAASLPAVVTRVGGNTEVITDGHNGYTVESDNVNEFAQAIVHLANDQSERRRMGEAARKRVEMVFDLKKSVQGYEELYVSSLIKKSG
jgi:sugar transferase (PEP-CTERM/EpsH1 system associated)